MTNQTKPSINVKANEGEVGNPISPSSDVDAEMHREKAAAAAAINQPHKANPNSVSININEEETIATNPPTDQGRGFARLARDLRASELASDDDITVHRHIAQATQNSLRDAAGAFHVNGSGVVTPASDLAAECDAASDESHPTTATEDPAQTSIYTNDNLPPNIDIIAEATLVKSEHGEHDEENPQQHRQEPAVVNAEQIDKFSIYVCGRHTRLWHLILLAAIVVAICVAVPVAVTSTNTPVTSTNKSTEQPPKEVLIWPHDELYDVVVPLISHPSAFNASDTNPSPQQQAFKFMTKTWDHTAPEGEPLRVDKTSLIWRIRQRYILAVLYYSTNGENWKNQYGFLTKGANECDWQLDDEGKSISRGEENSIDCTATGEITLIDLSHNNLQGPIPRELGSLQLSGGLHLEGNNLTGTVPQELAQLTQATRIYLNDNDLEGSIEFMCDALKPTDAPNGMYKNETGALSELYADGDKVECSCCSCCSHVEDDKDEDTDEETGEDGRV